MSDQKKEYPIEKNVSGIYFKLKDISESLQKIAEILQNISQKNSDSDSLF